MDTGDVLTVLKAQSGDRSAMSALLRGLQTPLLRYVGRMTGERDLASEIVQETLFAISRKLGALNQPQLLRPWAYRIATRETFRRLRCEKTHAHAPLETAENVASDFDENAAVDAVWFATLPALLNEISPASRAVLVLHYIEGLTLRDITEVLDVTLGTVKSRLAYGLLLLRRRFEESHLSEEKP